MKIKNLKLKNFRNYEELNIELDDNLNIFIGDNAQGKSNILESIVVLALTKSYMNVKDKNLIKNGTLFSNISANVDLGNTIDELFISFSDTEKKIKINNNLVKKYSDYISRVRFILFSPLDINLIKESPSSRRKFFNVEISQLSNRYVKLPEEIELPKQKLEKNYDNTAIPEIYGNVIDKNSQKINQNAKNIEKIAITDNYTVASKVREMFKVLVKQKRFVFNKLFSINKRNKQEVVTAFSGLLDLSRRNKVETPQEKLFGDITVEKCKRVE